MLNSMVRSMGMNKQNMANGVFHVKALRAGKLHKMIGMDNVLRVKSLTIVGQINVTDIYFILHMDNVEYLNLKDAIYLRKEPNESEKKWLRRELLSKKKKLKEIWFPASMTSVTSGLFKDCMELEKVVLPKTVTSISSYAFSNSGIRELVIPTSVKVIEPCAFDNCSRLEKVTVEDSKELLKWKGEQFRNCPNLKKIHLGRNSTFEYALITYTNIDCLELGKEICHMNFEVKNIRDMVCLMKRPLKLPKNIVAETIYIKHNFELFRLSPEWYKRNLQKM